MIYFFLTANNIKHYILLSLHCYNSVNPCCHIGKKNFNKFFNKFFNFFNLIFQIQYLQPRISMLSAGEWWLKPGGRWLERLHCWGTNLLAASRHTQQQVSPACHSRAAAGSSAYQQHTCHCAHTPAPILKPAPALALRQK